MSDRPAPDAARFQRAFELFHELVDATSQVRDLRIAELQRDDPALARELETLLAAEPLEAQGFHDLLIPESGPAQQGPKWPVPQKVGSYEIRSLLGSGGMGPVLRAWDPKLEREVALKLLPRNLERGRRERFFSEARSLAAFSHPGVVEVYSVEEEGDDLFFTMRLVQGTTLADHLQTGGQPLDTFFRWAGELVDALAAAHGQGIVHRDLKPGNVMVEPSGRLVLVDFGLVKRLPSSLAPSSDAGPPQTRPGQLMGTPGYMSPEQTKGAEVDARSDVFSLGILLYEMLTGQRPFQRPSTAEILAATLSGEHDPVRRIRPDVPKGLARLIRDCLAKRPEDRPHDAAEVARTLHRLARAHRSSTRTKTRAAATAALALAATASLLVLWYHRNQDRAIAEALEHITALQSERRSWQAFLGVKALLERDPDNEDAPGLLDELSIRTDIRSTPAGASIAVRSYEEPNGEWLALGETPIEDRDLPNDVLLLRAELEGHVPLEMQYEPRRGATQIDLAPEDQAPAGMVPVPAGGARLWGRTPVRVEAFWMDRHEVTNESYGVFLDSAEHAQLQAEVADLSLVDLTGRPGPAGWSVGSHPAGEGRMPVRGVSWFEANAYCAWQGKRLPTLAHWRRASPGRPSDHMARLSILNSDGPRPVGSSHAVSPTGVVDLAGNVAEWIANEVDGDRYTIGGSWRDPRYSADQESRRAPSERSATIGFRCISGPPGAEPELAAPLDLERIDFSRVEPVSDEVFAAYLALFDSDPTELDPQLVSTSEASPHWTRQRVSYATSYDDERIEAELFLPRDVAKPYQVVVYFPSASALVFEDSSQLADLPIVDFLPRSGRALLVPVYKGFYQRRTERLRGPAGLKQRWIHILQDLRQSVEYVIDHPDLDAGSMAYASLSLGSRYSGMALAVEPRFRTAVLIGGGFADDGMQLEPPEVNPWNYARHVTTPVLMINGRGDHILPVSTGQRPMFDLFGTAADHKRHLLLDGGPLPDDQNAIAGAALDWLDSYLGPVPRDRQPSGERNSP